MANQSNPTPADKAAEAAAKDAAEKAAAEAAAKEAEEKAAAEAAAKKAAGNHAPGPAGAPKRGKITALSTNGNVRTVTDGVEVWKHEGDMKDAVAPSLSARPAGAKSAGDASADAGKAPKRGKITVLSTNDKTHTVTDGVEVWKHEGDIKDAVAPSRAGKGGDA